MYKEKFKVVQNARRELIPYSNGPGQQLQVGENISHGKKKN